MRVVKGFFRSRTGSEAPASANWAGKARSKYVTDVGHKVQLPLGPSTRLCLETIRYKRGHNVLPPLGPSTGRLSEKLGFGGQGPQQVRYERWAQGTAAAGPLDQ